VRGAALRADDRIDSADCGRNEIDTMTEETKRTTLEAGMDILKTQGIATVLVLLLIWIGRDVSMRWLTMQQEQVSANVSLTKDLSASVREIVSVQRATTVFMEEVKQDHQEHTVLLAKIAETMDRLCLRLDSLGNLPRPSGNNGGT